MIDRFGDKTVKMLANRGKIDVSVVVGATFGHAHFAILIGGPSQELEQGFREGL